jgi:hypothetical protein
MPARADAFLTALREAGLAAGGSAIETSAAEILDRVRSDEAVVIAVDTFQATRDAIARTPQGADIYAQIVGRAPGHAGAYVGLALALPKHDPEPRSHADLLLATLASLSGLERTSSRVLTESGDALATMLLAPFRAQAAAILAEAFAAPEGRGSHPLTLVLASGAVPLAVVTADPGPMPLAAMRERARGFTSQWGGAPEAAVAFASTIRRTIDIRLLERRDRGEYAVTALHAFSALTNRVPAAATD